MSGGGGMDAVVAAGRELARLREQLLAQQQKSLLRAAELIGAAAREGRAIHLVGEDLCAPLAAYLGELLLHGDERRILPARPLLPAGRDVDGLARAVQACVRKGDVVLVLSTQVSPGLMRAVSRTRLRGGTSVALLSENTAHTLACDVSLAVPAPQPQVAHELFLALGHALHGLVVVGLAEVPADGQGESSALEDIPVSQDSFADHRVIDRDLDSQLDSPLDSEAALAPRHSTEAALLQAAVDSLAVPPTDPRGAQRRGGGAPTLPPAVFRFRCGGCEKVVTVDPRQAGKRGHCPHCRIEFIIPQPRDAVAPPPGPSRGAIPVQPAPGRGTGRMGTTPPGGIPSPALPPSPARADPARPWGPSGPRPRAPVKERRRATRVNVRDAVLRWGREDFPGAGDRPQEPYPLDDLSLTGLRFMGPPQDLKVGEIVHLLLDFPAYPDPVRVKAQVRRVNGPDGGTPAAVGVRFVQWVGDAEVRVRRLVENAQLRSVRRR